MGRTHLYEGSSPPTASHSPLSVPVSVLSPANTPVPTATWRAGLAFAFSNPALLCPACLHGPGFQPGDGRTGSGQLLASLGGFAYGWEATLMRPTLPEQGQEARPLGASETFPVPGFPSPCTEQAVSCLCSPEGTAGVASIRAHLPLAGPDFSPAPCLAESEPAGLKATGTTLRKQSSLPPSYHSLKPEDWTQMYCRGRRGVQKGR